MRDAGFYAKTLKMHGYRLCQAFDKHIAIDYNLGMQKDNPKLENLKEKILPLPLFVTMALFVLLALGGVLFFVYSVALVVATHSAMVFLIVFAAAFIAEGLGALSLHGFFAYKKYYKNRISGFKHQPEAQTKEKTFKDYLTVQNVSLVLLLVGAVFAIVSAAIGALSRDKWIKAVSPYMASHGYYADVEYRNYRYTATEYDGVKSISIDLDGKTAVVIYTEDEQKQGFVTVNGYEKYANQISVRLNGDHLEIVESEKPALGTLEKMLFFMFDENKIEKQIKIYVPLSLKNMIEIDGEHIIAK